MGFKDKFDGFMSCKALRKDIILMENNICVRFLGTYADMSHACIVLGLSLILLTLVYFIFSICPIIRTTKADYQEDLIQSQESRTVDDIEVSARF